MMMVFMCLGMMVIVTKYVYHVRVLFSISTNSIHFQIKYTITDCPHVTKALRLIGLDVKFSPLVINNSFNLQSD